MYEIKKTPEFEIWLNGISDPLTRGRLLARLRKVSMGNLGDVAAILDSDGVWEM
jgi:putative component of toxin-antitoxin plasmid stabilization module